jgi:hypothetical protein
MGVLVYVRGYPWDSDMGATSCEPLRYLELILRRRRRKACPANSTCVMVPVNIGEGTGGQIVFHLWRVFLQWNLHIINKSAIG